MDLLNNNVVINDHQQMVVIRMDFMECIHHIHNVQIGNLRNDNKYNYYLKEHWYFLCWFDSNSSLLWRKRWKKEKK